VIDVAAVPDGLEDAVGETEDHDVLDRFFAQVMIDAVDLAFFRTWPISGSAPGGFQVAEPKGFSMMTRRQWPDLHSISPWRELADDADRRTGAVAR
jgi:hypothetical protein